MSTFASGGSSGQPTTPLAAGVYFWRARPMASGRVTGKSGTVWEFFVGARGTLVDTSWGSVPDINGDGLADVLITGGGAVYVYLGSAGGIATTPSMSVIVNDGGGPVGGVSMAGDLNGDGFADALVGTDVYLGGSDGLAANPVAILEPAGSVILNAAAAGDVNGDGYADLFAVQDATYVYLGGPQGPVPSARVKISLLNDAQVPWVASAGDVNGDRYGDVVSTTGHGLNFPAENTAVYLGGPAGLGAATEAPLPLMDGPTPFSQDVNGDGFCDLVFQGNTTGTSFSVQVLLGGPSGLSAQTSTVVLQAPGSQVLEGIVNAGDVDGDGFADVVSAGRDGPLYLSTPTFEVDVFSGGSGGLAADSSSRIAGTEASAYSGFSPTGLGDVNGDGFDDVSVALTFGYAPNGKVNVYLGGPHGLSKTPFATLTSGTSDSYFPGDVASWL